MLFFNVYAGFVNMDMSDSYRFKEVYRGHVTEFSMSIMLGRTKGNIILTHWNGIGCATVL